MNGITKNVKAKIASLGEVKLLSNKINLSLLY